MTEQIQADLLDAALSAASAATASAAKPPAVNPSEHQDSAAENLLRHPDLWRAGQLAANTVHKGLATGYAGLDKLLPGRGWPQAGLMEMLLACAGVGELRLLAPAMRALSHTQERWIAWVNPPFIPYAPALEAAGVDISRILLIHPQNHKDTLWSVERACKSGTCSLVLAWPDEKKLKLKDTQRLQVAAKQGGTLACLLRPQSAQAQPSMAELRLGLKAGTEPGQLRLDVLKRRGGWPVQDVTLNIDTATGTRHRRQQDVQQQLTLWRAQHISAPQAPLQDSQETPLHAFERPDRDGSSHVEQLVH